MTTNSLIRWGGILTLLAAALSASAGVALLALSTAGQGPWLTALLYSAGLVTVALAYVALAQAQATS